MNIHTLILLFILHHCPRFRAELVVESEIIIPSTTITPENWTDLIVKEDERREKERCSEIESQYDSVIREFGESFNDLSNYTLTNSFFVNKPKTILFVGNTGSGKSTLVQTLAGDNTKLIAEEISSYSGDFLITGPEIGSVTANSKTTHPVLVHDAESGILLCDSPGFKDTRDAQHEVVATYDMRKVVEYSKSVKIAIVVTHDSVRKGMNRDDFPNLLKHVLEFVKDIDKYLYNSIYLIPTKVNNDLFKRNGKRFLVSDETMINNVAGYLNETKSAFEERVINGKADTKLYRDSVKLINALLLKDETGAYKRIAIFRKPDESGPLSSIETIRDARMSIRNTLLNDNHFTNVDVSDFGYTISEKATLYLNELFQRMNNYVSGVTKSLSLAMTKYYTSVFDSFYDIEMLINDISLKRLSVEEFSRSIGTSKNPGEYAAKVDDFFETQNLNFCKDFLKNITTLNNYLDNLKNLAGDNNYFPTVWNTSLITVNKFITKEEKYYFMLRSVFDKLSGYNNQRENTLYNLVAKENRVYYNPDVRALANKQKFINKHNYKKFLEKLDLDQFNDIVLTDVQLNMLDIIVENSIKNNVDKICLGDTLTIMGDFLLTQEIDKGTLMSCPGAKTVVIIAAHTLYIDSNLDTSTIEGRNILMIAPKWVVKGRRHISVDGSPPDDTLPKASHGEIGSDGKHGIPAGSFVGVGMFFENGKDLTISASGGFGQNGQEGGDGRHGQNGVDGDKSIVLASNSKIYLVYNQFKETSIVKGTRGTAGEDAGAGGSGGEGGRKGSIEIHNLGNDTPDFTTVLKDGEMGKPGQDGIPGRGGFNGCDKKVEVKDNLILFIPVGSSNNDAFIDCKRINPNGNVISFPRKEQPFYWENRYVPPICPFYSLINNHNIKINIKSILTFKLFKTFDDKMENELGCST